MAEIRIPTDRIPADILHRLQAIGHSIIFPGSSATTSSATATATAATATTTPTKVPSPAAETSTVLAQYDPRRHAHLYAQNEAGTFQGHFSQSSESFPHHALPFHACPSYTSSTPTQQTSATTTSTSSSPLQPTPKSSLSSYPSTSSSPPLLGPFSSPPGPPSGEKSSGFAGHVDQFSPHTGVSLSPSRDETDGQASQLNQESIVHALDLNKHRKRGGHPVDESDIVRIFPMTQDDRENQEEPDNLQSPMTHPAEIVRIFPEADIEPAPSEPKRVYSTPTKNKFSSSRQQKGSSNKSCNNNANSSSISSSSTATSSNVHNHQQASVQPPANPPALPTCSIVPHVLPVFTLGDNDDEDDDDDEKLAVDGDSDTPLNRNSILLNSTPSKRNPAASPETTPKFQRHIGAPAYVSHPQNNPSHSMATSTRLTPPVSGLARRSPGGLVTPPMTPDDFEEDEVFSYDLSRDDSLPLSNRRALDVYRQSIESTPRRNSPAPSVQTTSNQRRHSDLSIEQRQLKHAQLQPYHAHTAGSAPPKCSPFSPAQRLSELSFGDRQLTRKRLSFEDCDQEKPQTMRFEDVFGVGHAQSSKQVNSDKYSVREESAATSTLGSSHHSEPALAQHHHHHQYSSNSNRNINDSSTHNNFFEISHQSPRAPHLKSQNFRPRPSKSVSPSIKSHSILPQFSSSQSQESRTNFNSASSPLSHAYFKYQAFPPSTAQPMTSQFSDAPFRGVMTHPDHVTHKTRALHRGRLHSEGDDATAETSGSAQGRQRLQTFSHGKRRRLDAPEDTKSIHLLQQQKHQNHIHQQQQVQQQQQNEQHHQQQQQEQQQQQHQQQFHYGHVSTQPAQNPQEPQACACATIERDFLQVAECAYKRIRRLDNTPGDFDRFRREMAQTNDMLKEWLLIMGNIRNICGHAPSTSQQQAAAVSTTSAPLQSAPSFSPSTSFTSSPLPFSSPPMVSSLPSAVAPSMTSTLFPPLTTPTSSSTYSIVPSQQHQQHRQTCPASSSSSTCTSSLLPKSSVARPISLASREFIDPGDDVDETNDDNQEQLQISDSVFDRQFQM